MLFNGNKLLKSIFLASTVSILGSMSAVQAEDINVFDLQNQTRSNLMIIKTINIAEAYVVGSQAMKVEEESRYGKNIYSVEMSDMHGNMTDVWVNTQTGDVLGSMAGFVSEKVKEINRKWYSSMTYGIYINLHDAIIQAEKITGLDALRADFDYNADVDGEYYEVDLVDKFGVEHEIHISPLDPSIPGCNNDDFSNPSGINFKLSAENNMNSKDMSHSRSHSH